jgi:NTE family protein
MAQVVRQPVYIWANQKRVAEHFQQDLSTGILFGRTFSPELQIDAEWRSLNTRWSPISGSAGGSYIDGTSQTAQFHFTLDRTQSGTISPEGFRLTASAGALFNAIASSDAPIVKAAFSRTSEWRQNNIFAIGADLNSYLRARVAQPFLFSLGGPLHLSSASFDEYRGTDTFLTRAAYLRRIAALPTGKGQGLYGVFNYESGEIWSSDHNAILRQDGTLGLIANTPFGAITTGGSVGDAGHRKFFFTLGRLF